jgi:hypothetical protein
MRPAARALAGRLELPLRYDRRTNGARQHRRPALRLAHTLKVGPHGHRARQPRGHASPHRSAARIVPGDTPGGGRAAQLPAARRTSLGDPRRHFLGGENGAGLADAPSRCAATAATSQRSDCRAAAAYPVFRNSWPGVRANGRFLRGGAAKVGTTGRAVMLTLESDCRGASQASKASHTLHPKTSDLRPVVNNR